MAWSMSNVMGFSGSPTAPCFCRRSVRLVRRENGNETAKAIRYSNGLMAALAAEASSNVSSMAFSRPWSHFIAQAPSGRATAPSGIRLSRRHVSPTRRNGSLAAEEDGPVASICGSANGNARGVLVGRKAVHTWAFRHVRQSREKLASLMGVVLLGLANGGSDGIKAVSRGMA